MSGETEKSSPYSREGTINGRVEAARTRRVGVRKPVLGSALTVATFPPRIGQQWLDTGMDPPTIKEWDGNQWRYVREATGDDIRTAAS